MKILEFNRSCALIKDPWNDGGPQKWTWGVKGERALLLTPIDEPIIFEGPYMNMTSQNKSTRGRCRGWCVLKGSKICVLWNFIGCGNSEPWNVGWCYFLDVDNKT